MKSGIESPTAPRIGPSGRTALQLLACCSHLPTDVVATLLRVQHTRSAAQLLVGLRSAGLARYQTVKPGPLVGSRGVRLWTLTPEGQVALARRGLDHTADRRALLSHSGSGRARDGSRLRQTSMLVAAYRLLAHVVRIMDGPVLVGTWEQPWIRTLVHTEAGRARHVRLPAAAALVHQGRECPVLLLPDLGTVPVASYRPTIRRLMDLRKTIDGNDELDELLLVVGVAVGVHPSARLAAWHSLLGDVARRTGEEPLHARVVPCPPGLAAHTNRGRPIGDQTEQALALIARHPLLTRLQLASLLGTSETRTSGLVRRLTAESWVRSIQSVDVSLGDRHTSRQRALLELTPSGRREAVRRLLLPAGVAARYHGLLGKPASTRRFLRHLAHTVGANDVFVAFADAARRETVRGGDDALEEWRSAAACARGRFRPDGYGCYRRGAWRFGFFVEYDRGTERPSHYAVKLAAYYRYRDSFAFRRDYDGFPTLLVVTTSDAAEARFAYQAHLTQRQRGSAPLAVLFTTTPRIEGHADGILGPIWRAPGADPWTERSARVRWLPGLPRAPTAKGGHATPSFRQAAA